MGKAVTKKIMELITLMKTRGSQPMHINSKVWERLQKLVASKQWEERSQHGRYVNACKKMINIKGTRRVNGVRENMREILGRSSDPDKVYTEAHRRKGSRVKKEKKIQSVQNETKLHMRTRQRRTVGNNRWRNLYREESMMRELATSLR